MKSLIVGMGEVGKGLYEVLKDYYEVETYDLNKGTEPGINSTFDILHICFPYVDRKDNVKGFIDYVKAYQIRYQPKYTVVHSTVPVGTCRQLGAISSPIRGLHPNLASGIRTFVKFLGGDRASEVADYFRRAGIKVCLFDKQENAEALKLFDTEYYRVCIEFAHRVKKYCTKHGLSFSDVYRIGNKTYNEGYIKLGYSEFVRPVLEPIMKEIGGHCVMSNKELIKMSEDE